MSPKVSPKASEDVSQKVVKREAQKSCFPSFHCYDRREIKQDYFSLSKSWSPSG